jgi:hypothetical protein
MHMPHFRKRALLLVAAGWPLAYLAAQQPPAKQAAVQQPAAQAGGAAASGSAAVDPAAIAALDHMGAYLRTLTAFQIEARTATENVTEDGFKLQFDGVATLKVRRPDRLHVDISNARKQRQIFYDGKSVTVYGPRVKYYATVPAPQTLGETIQVLAKKYGIETPLADLFYWGTDQSGAADIKAAHHIGPATIDGKQTDHYAFRQEGVDWQLWIQQGEKPLPLKMAITSTAEAAQPTYSVGLRWNLSPRLQETAFVFKPPPGAMKIVMQTADGKPVSFK